MELLLKLIKWNLLIVLIIISNGIIAQTSKLKGKKSLSIINKDLKKDNDTIKFTGFLLYDNKEKKAWLSKSLNLFYVNTGKMSYEYELTLDAQFARYPKAKKIGLGLCLSEDKYIIEKDKLYKKRYKFIEVKDLIIYRLKLDNKTYYVLCNR